MRSSRSSSAARSGEMSGRTFMKPLHVGHRLSSMSYRLTRRRQCGQLRRLEYSSRACWFRSRSASLAMAAPTHQRLGACNLLADRALLLFAFLILLPTFDHIPQELFRQRIDAPQYGNDRVWFACVAWSREAGRGYGRCDADFYNVADHLARFQAVAKNHDRPCRCAGDVIGAPGAVIRALVAEGQAAHAGCVEEQVQLSCAFRICDSVKSGGPFTRLSTIIIVCGCPTQSNRTRPASPMASPRCTSTTAPVSAAASSPF